MNYEKAVNDRLTMNAINIPNLININLIFLLNIYTTLILYLNK